MKLITFLSDFGSNSSYVSQMKGVTLSITDAKIIDITHNITTHNVREGAFLLRTSVPYFPTGTVHVAVVDPGVGTNRKGIVITTPTQILVGPDNGLLIPAARFLGNFTVYEITNTKLMLPFVSYTFHGRDIFSPVAAHILNGTLFEHIGPIISNFVDLNFGNYKINDSSAIGKVLFSDSFGNVITNIDGLEFSNVSDFGKRVTFFIGKKTYRAQFVKSYGFVKKGEILLTNGSSNFLEFSINQGNAAKKLGVKPDDDVKILF
jgi:S-adenosyl-L-methionine hydrolase (adenosine-forming)